MARAVHGRRLVSLERQLALFPPEAEVAVAAPSRGLPRLHPIFADLNARFFGSALAARIEWSERLTATAGTCRPGDRLIRVSAPYHRRAPHALPVTLAHEMIHLLVPGHGREFRRLGEPIARRLDVSWSEFRYAARWADLQRYRYVYACPECGRETPSRKRLRASCGRCQPAAFDERFRLALVESRTRPGPVLLGARPARTD
jgi:predicted SprT family Zn-dependent metalloprotease